MRISSFYIFVLVIQYFSLVMPVISHSGLFYLVFLVSLHYHQVQEKQSKIDELDQEQITLIDMIAEERGRRDALEKSLRNKLKVSRFFLDCKILI